MELFCETGSSSDRLLHQLDDDLLGSVAAAVAEGQDARIAARAVLFVVALCVLGRDLVEELFDEREC